MTPEERFIENENLVYFVLKSYYPNFLYNEDYQQEGRVGLWRACLAFDETRNIQFSTVAVLYIRNAIQSALQRDYRRGEAREFRMQMLSLDCPVAAHKTGEQIYFRDTIPGDMDVDFYDIRPILSRLTLKQKTAFLLALQGMNRLEIAKEMKVSKSLVYKMFTKIRRIYEKYG